MAIHFLLLKVRRNFNNYNKHLLGSFLANQHSFKGNYIHVSICHVKLSFFHMNLDSIRKINPFARGFYNLKLQIQTFNQHISYYH